MAVHKLHHPIQGRVLFVLMLGLHAGDFAKKDARRNVLNGERSPDRDHCSFTVMIPKADTQKCSSPAYITREIRELRAANNNLTSFFSALHDQTVRQRATLGAMERNYKQDYSEDIKRLEQENRFQGALIKRLEVLIDRKTKAIPTRGLEERRPSLSLGGLEKLSDLDADLVRKRLDEQAHMMDILEQLTKRLDGENRDQDIMGAKLDSRVAELSETVVYLSTAFKTLEKEYRRKITQLQDIVVGQDAGFAKHKVESLQRQLLVMQKTNSHLQHALVNQSRTIRNLRLKVNTLFRQQDGLLLADDTTQTIAITDQCGNLTHVSDPATHRTSSTLYGAWMKDPLACKGDVNSIWLMEDWYSNVVLEYSDMENFLAQKEAETYNLPYNWWGTGHVVYKGALFYHSRNKIVKYDFMQEEVVAERKLNNIGPYHYQWGGATLVDFAVDEKGLWAIYAAQEDHGKLVVSMMDPDDLSFTQTWTTEQLKTDAGNAFMICGVLYTTRSDIKQNIINYAFDTETGKSNALSIPLVSKYGATSMVDYNPKDKMIYAWDNGNLVTYNVTLETFGKT
ncbi:OLFM1 [Branchiostoma lanceolatum]|uniref:OLFM1 protein n=1 Tax=Branchiostoma lanceolatum TaxID=7740 RepID=A0A8J9YXD8_BRALA|nr:OLFM1 [Branchiostoma lanceolatum]